MTHTPPQRTPAQVAFAQRRHGQLEQITRVAGAVGVVVVAIAIILAVGGRHSTHHTVVHYVGIGVGVIGVASLVIAVIALVGASMFEQWLHGPPRQTGRDPWAWLYESGPPSHPLGMKAWEEAERRPPQPPNT